MENRVIKINLDCNELEALKMGYQQAVEQMEHEAQAKHYTLHETLLLEHAIVLRDRLEKMHKRGQNKYTLSLKPLEAMAIFQLWQRPFAITTYSGNVVRKVFGKIEEGNSKIL